MQLPPEENNQLKWIWEKDKKDNANQSIAYFRRTFELSELPKKALQYCCADSRYRLWVNRNYVSFGPARSHPSVLYYDTHNITKHLHKGKNCIAFLVYYYGTVRFFASVRPALICQVESDGKIIVATNVTWKVKNASAYLLDKARNQNPSIFGLEVFDANKEPKNWTGVEFNDKNWENAYRKK